VNTSRKRRRRDADIRSAAAAAAARRSVTIGGGGVSKMSAAAARRRRRTALLHRLRDGDHYSANCMGLRMAAYIAAGLVFVHAGMGCGLGSTPAPVCDA